MKALPVLASIAALVAFALLPIVPAIAGSALFLITLAPIVLADYTRVRPLAATVVPVRVATRRSERLRLAA